METDALAVIIGQNITRLRRLANMTQSELAEQLNYSDKSVSKWEQGYSAPDVHILLQIADFFHVSIDDLVREHKEKEIEPKTTRNKKRLIIILCSVGLCWLVAVALFVFIGIALPNLEYLWLAFLYAVPVSSIIVLVFSSVWGYRTVRVVSISVLIWTTLACVFLTVLAFGKNIWLIFLIGIPLQILALFYFVWREKVHFFRKK